MRDESWHREIDEIHNELMEMDASRLFRGFIDPLSRGTMVIGVLPAIRSHRAEVERELGPERARCIDRLEPLANAMLRLHATCATLPPTRNLEPVVTELNELRAVFTTEVKNLIRSGVVHRRSLSEVSGRIGRQVIIADVLMLVSILHEHVEDDGRSCGVTRAELARAEALADELSHHLADPRCPEHLAAADLRLRAFSLMAETYDEVRRLISFVRWKDGDADEIAPSLWACRAKRKGGVRPA